MGCVKEPEISSCGVSGSWRSEDRGHCLHRMRNVVSDLHEAGSAQSATVSSAGVYHALGTVGEVCALSYGLPVA